jgi:hypothetical protein
VALQYCRLYSAAYVDAEMAAFMADSQVRGVGALGGTVSRPAWASKPSWHLVASEDGMILPDVQRAMVKRAGATVVEEPGSHAIYVSKPGTVAHWSKRPPRACRLGLVDGLARRPLARKWNNIGDLFGYSECKESRWLSRAWPKRTLS